MNTSPNNPTNSQIDPAGWRARAMDLLNRAVQRWLALSGRMRIITGAGAAVAVLLLAWIAGLFGGNSGPTQTPIYFTASRESMLVSVDQPGTIEASNKVIVRVLIRQDTAEITWMIEEGSDVQPGDVLVKLDTTKFEDQRTEREQRVDSARSSLITARVNLENTTSQAESDTAQAELNYEFAELAHKKYIEGEYPQDLQKAEGDVTVADEALQRAQDEADASAKLYEKNYITLNELKADQAALTRAKLELEVAQGSLELLKNYTFYQRKRQLESDAEQAKAELERVKNKSEADIEKSRAEFATSEANLTRAERELEQTMQDLANCEIKAPVAGRVVYAPQGNNWRREEPLAVGNTVNFNQEIIHLPESGQMIASIKIDESQRDKVQLGMPVRITLPSMPDKVLFGRLTKIAEYLDPSGWWNNNQKVYSATVDIVEGNIDELRTGMNCQTQIVVASYDDVLTVPLQAVTRVGKQPVVYLPGDTPVRREVVVGLDNGRKINVTEGLKAGERVLLDPPLEPSAKPEDDAAVPENLAQAKTANGQTPSAPGQPGAPLGSAGGQGTQAAAPSTPGQPRVPSGSTAGQGAQPGAQPPGGAQANAGGFNSGTPEEQAARRFGFLRMARDNGWMANWELDETTTANINQALDANDQSLLTEETNTKIRQAFERARQRMQQQGGAPGSGPPGGQQGGQTGNRPQSNP